MEMGTHDAVWQIAVRPVDVGQDVEGRGARVASEGRGLSGPLDGPSARRTRRRGLEVARGLEAQRPRVGQHA